jgi:hypothetical protein
MSSKQSTDCICRSVERNVKSREDVWRRTEKERMKDCERVDEEKKKKNGLRRIADRVQRRNSNRNACYNYYCQWYHQKTVQRICQI